MKNKKFLPQTGSPLVSRPAESPRLPRDQRGQATVEYILLLSLVLVAALTLNSTLVKTIDQSVVKLGAELQRNLKTGRPSETNFRFVAP